MTVEQRIATFDRLRGVREKTTTTVIRNCIGDCIERVDKILYLADGTEIHHVDDLLPVLPDDSESAQAIRAARNARTNGRIWTGVVFALMLGTLVLWKQLPEHADIVLLSGAGLATVGGLFLRASYREAARQEGRANLSYNQGLAEQLYLCVRGMQLVPCETLPMPGTTPKR